MWLTEMLAVSDFILKAAVKSENYFPFEQGGGNWSLGT